MSEFVKARMVKGINRERAMDECAEMVEILFKYEERFKFKYPVVSIGILGQGKLKWVTDKIEDYLLSERIKERYRKRMEFNEGVEKKHKMEILEDAYSVEEDLAKILQEMEE